jgi:hypothetical protein
LLVKTQDGKSVGNELACGDLKDGCNGGRTPFVILGHPRRLPVDRLL